MFTTLSRSVAQATRVLARPVAQAPKDLGVRCFQTARPTPRVTSVLAACKPPSAPVLPQSPAARTVSTLSWKFRPYALSSAPVTGLAPLSAGYTAVGLTLFAAPEQVLLTTAGVLGMLGLANLAHGAVNRGGAFTHNWLMIFFQLVMTFMPVPCFENLFTDLTFIAMFLLGTVFTLNLLPEVLLKDMFVMSFLIAFMMPLLPIAFSMMPAFNSRAYFFA
jgi:hypothetical protein